MKFAEHLSAHITPEWRKQYITYEAMKEQLYEAVEQSPSPEMTPIDIIQQHFARFDEKFFQYCDKELLKINTFFSEKMAEATRKFAGLQSDLSQSVSEPMEPRVRGMRRRRRHEPVLVTAGGNGKIARKPMHDVKLAFSEFYLSLILLQSYQTLNFTGFRKILKKHDKLLSTDRGAVWRQSHVETAAFYINKEVDNLIKETENVFTQSLEGGDRQKAMKRLRVPPLGETQNAWITFRVGFFTGICITLLMVAAVVGVLLRHEREKDFLPALRMYRGLFLVILFIVLLSVNTYGWRSSGVNHVLIFELDPRHHITHQELMELGGFLAALWCISVVSYLVSDMLFIPVFVHPLGLVCFCLVFLFNPLPVLHHKARWWLLRVLFRIFTAPFHYVGFADFWLADQLNSLTTVLLDLEYLICFYAIEVNWFGQQGPSVCGGVTYGIRPLVAALPAWFRFAQCLRRYRDTRLGFPHLVNAGKYATTFLVVLFSTLNSLHKATSSQDAVDHSAFLYVWVVSAFVSTCYTFIWDVRMDWGLFDKGAGDNRYLREEIVYSRKAYYYFAIVEDLVLRFMWTITVTVTIVEEEFSHSEILKTFIASLEVFRRFVWTFFRLENEHLNNCGQFRAVRDISIVPINSSDQVLLEKMMDEEDGVTNRRTAIPTHKRRTGLIRPNKSDVKLLIHDD